MANTPQAKKRIRRNNRRAEVNGARVGRIRTFIKAVESALLAGDKDAASEALKRAQPEMQRGGARLSCRSYQNGKAAGYESGGLFRDLKKRFCYRDSRANFDYLL